MQSVLFWAGVLLFEAGTAESLTSWYVYSDGGPLEAPCRMVRRSERFVVVVYKSA